jgi:hypothetical protein
VLRTLVDAALRRRFAWLLALLIAAIGIDPVFEAMGLRGRAFEWVLASALGAAVLGAWRAGGSRLFVLGFTAVLGAGLVAHAVRFGSGASLATAVLGASAFAMAGFLLSAVLAAGRVDAERICAALSVYLLVGIAFGGIFATLEAVAPGSLRGPEPIRLEGALYFSFVTLATLGYGDVVPASAVARPLAMLEAVFGQLYLVVLVARLVSLYSGRRE